MNTRLFRRVLGIAVAAILLLVSSAAAADMPPERTFPIVGVNDGGPVVHIGPRTDADQVVSRFAVEYRRTTNTELTWRILHTANPRSTIAVCFTSDPPYNKRNPHDPSIWDGCASKDQNIALIAGAYLWIPMETMELLPDKLLRLELIDKALTDIGCTDLTSQDDCLLTKVKAASNDKPIVKIDATKFADSASRRSTAELAAEVVAVTKERDAAIAELDTRPTRGKWASDLVVMGLMCLAIGLVAGFQFGRSRGRKEPVKASVAMMEAKLSPAKSGKRPSEQITQKSLPRPGEEPRPDPTVQDLRLKIVSLGKEKAEIQKQLVFARSEREEMRQKFVALTAEQTDLRRKLKEAQKALQERENANEERTTLPAQDPDLGRRLAVVTEEHAVLQVRVTELEGEKLALDKYTDELTSKLDAALQDATEARVSEATFAEALAKAEQDLKEVSDSTAIAEDIQKELEQKPYEAIPPDTRELYRKILGEYGTLGALAATVGRLNSESVADQNGKHDLRGMAEREAVMEELAATEVELMGNLRQFTDRVGLVFRVSPSEMPDLLNVFRLIGRTSQGEESPAPAGPSTSSPGLGPLSSELLELATSPMATSV
ncbi:hypothetical protein KJ925_02420 [Patescibacteria group bacterium]|nr:hypothetical protein [Patescibacteria group bacterium]